jgi:regulator of protease activity HflC (stomatin/prohibitin superfamily)
MEFLIIALVLVAAGVASLYRREVPRIGSAGIFAAAIIAVIAACLVVVPAGHVGVKVLFGNVRPGYLQEGIHLINPLLKVRDMSVRAQAYTMSGTVQEGEVKRDDSITVLSKDGLQLKLDVTVTYKLLAEDAAWVYQKLGDQYTRKIIRPAVRTAIREAASEFESSLAYAEKRKELASKTEEYLLDRLDEILRKTDKGKAGLKLGKDGAFVIQQVLLRNVELPARQRNAIEEKLAMQQEALRMEFVIQKEEKEKQRKKIEGEGIAQRMEIIKKQLSPDFLRFKGIEATLKLAESNNAKVIVIGGGEDGLPLILDADK